MGLCPDCLFAAALDSESTVEGDDVLPATSGTLGSAPSYESFGLCSRVVKPTSTEGPEPFGLDEPSGLELDDTRLVNGSHQTLVWPPSFVLRAGPDLPRDPRVPGYEILGMLGRGGMGVVYKGLQCRACRLVALKMVRSDAALQPEQFERFRVEAQAVARLHHPNVVQIYEVGEVDGRPYFSLELLEGGTLREKLTAAMMAPRPAAELLVVLTRAIEAAHGAGIIHRDLKPTNVLFDAQGTPKIVDFGLAKWLESEEGQTLTGQVVGTPSYMSPEQARGDNRAVGRTADIYALGAILYEMLTGRPPFKGTSQQETINMVASQDPIAPSRFRQKVPRDLETICLKCLEKDPARRYQTASGLADDLERYLSGMPVRARRTPVWERAAKWARRRPATTTLAAVGLIVALTLASAAERDHRRLGTRRREALFELERGREQRRRGALDDARLTFATVSTKLDPESKLADLVRVAGDELRAVDRLRSLDAARAVDQERLTRFRRLRDEALFLDAQFAGSVDAGRLKRTRAAARGRWPSSRPVATTPRCRGLPPSRSRRSSATRLPRAVTGC